jgi:release factor glutamine methyltransferase
MGGVYRPAEDSMLLARHVERLVYGSVLDMGTGRGIQAVTSASKPGVERVVAVDVNPNAIAEAKRRAAEAGVDGKVKFMVSDLFENVEGRFDWIIFNPPYLPSEGEADELSWAGGGEIVGRFLSEAAEHLKEGGAVLLVYSSLTGIYPEEHKEYSWEVLEELPLFFEMLYCVLLRPVSPS